MVDSYTASPVIPLQPLMMFSCVHIVQKLKMFSCVYDVQKGG